MKVVSEKSLDLVGVEKERTYDVTRRDIKRFAQAIDDPNPLFYDEEFAKQTRFKSIIAPPLFCQTFAFEDVPLGELPKDGSPVEIDVELPAKRTVGGGSVYEIFQHVRPGDTIKAKSKITQIYEKQGKSGTLYFLTVETTFVNQTGEIVAKETATFIKR